MLQKHFEEITDERELWKIKHDMVEIIVMTIYAVIGGCDA